MADLVAVPVWDALVARVMLAAPPANGILSGDRIYRDGEVPTNAVLGYVLIGGATEPKGGFYNGQTGRTRTLFRLHCWSDTPTNAARIAAWMTALIDGQLLTLDGHTMWESQVTALPHAPDTDRTAWQVPLNWEVSTLEA